jgi:hypothetical protein
MTRLQTLFLVLVDDPVSRKIWLIEQGTVANIPKLHTQVKSKAPTAADRISLAIQGGRQLLGMSSGQWLGWLVSIPLSWLLAWLLIFLLSAPRRVWCKLQRHLFTTVWDTRLGTPLRCMIAILLHSFSCTCSSRRFCIASTIFVSWEPSWWDVLGGLRAEFLTKASTTRYTRHERTAVAGSRF